MHFPNSSGDSSTHHSSPRQRQETSLPSSSSRQGPAGALVTSLPVGQAKASGPPSLGRNNSFSDNDNRNGSSNWQYLVALCAMSVVICYADRSNISTAILPMAEQFHWDKAYEGVVLSSFFAGYAATQVRCCTWCSVCCGFERCPHVFADPSPSSRGTK